MTYTCLYNDAYNAIIKYKDMCQAKDCLLQVSSDITNFCDGHACKFIFCDNKCKNINKTSTKYCNNHLCHIKNCGDYISPSMSMNCDKYCQEHKCSIFACENIALISYKIKKNSIYFNIIVLPNLQKIKETNSGNRCYEHHESSIKYTFNMCKHIFLAENIYKKHLILFTDKSLNTFDNYCLTNFNGKCPSISDRNFVTFICDMMQTLPWDILIHITKFF
jgi:hypothetical protein